jgi:hypothetical protein
MTGIGHDRLTRVVGGWNRVTMENGSIPVTGMVITDGLNTIIVGIMIGRTGITTIMAGTMTATKGLS